MDAPPFVAHVAIDDDEVQRFGKTLETVTRGDPFELGVGVEEQQVQGVALGDGAEACAVSGPDQGVQLFPRRGLGALASQLFEEIRGLRATLVVVEEVCLRLG